jgi:hypothetical protein
LKGREDRHDWIVGGAYMCILYVGSLRGREGTFFDLEGLLKHNDHDNARRGFCMITLLGKVKGETQDREHLISSTLVTRTGLRVNDVLTRLVRLKTSIGLKMIVGQQFRILMGGHSLLEKWMFFFTQHLV